MPCAPAAAPSTEELLASCLPNGDTLPSLQPSVVVPRPGLEKQVLEAGMGIEKSDPKTDEGGWATRVKVSRVSLQNNGAKLGVG